MQPRILASAIYFFYFAAGGALSPYLNLYYQTVGISKQQIGLLIAATTLMNVLSSPIWSAIADAFNLHRYLLPLAMFGTAIPVALLMQSSEFWALLLLVVVYAFFMGPIVPLTDNAVLEMLGDDRDKYGRLRVWGAVGFGSAAWGAGLLAEHLGMGTIFVLFIVFMSLCGLLATKLPPPQIKVPDSYLRNLRRLSTNMTWLAFLGATLLVGITSSMFHNYYVLYMTDLGASESLYGLSVAAAGVTELPVFFFSALLIRRLSPRGVLMIAFLAFAVRSFLVSIISDPQLAILPQLLHGLSFSAMWTAAVVYVSQIVPAGLGATAQASLGLVTFGLSGTIGGLVGAAIYENFGAPTLFRIGALSALIGLAMLIMIEMRSRHTKRMQLSRLSSD